MSKVLGYLVMLSGILLFFNIFGVSTASTSLIQFLLHPETYSTSQIFVKIGLIIGVFTVAGAVSYFIQSSFKIDFIATAGLVALLLQFAIEILSVYNAIAVTGAVGYLFGIIIISPFLLLYGLSVYEWWRGVNY